MADWDSADLLARFIRGTDLEDSNELDTTTEAYPIIADAQEEVVRFIAGVAPDALMEGPAAMTTDADRKVFSFATVNGNAVHMMGRVQIAPRLSAFTSNRDFVGWVEDSDFINEGTRIRIPGDRSFSGTLYARGIPRPPRITSAVGPSLRPIEANVLTVNRAVRKWAAEGNKRPDIVRVMDEEWHGNPRAGIPGMWALWAHTFKRTHRGGGWMVDPARWYFANPDLG